MHFTEHMTQRMGQRNFSDPMVSAVLDLGEWNARGDRLTVDGRQHAELDIYLLHVRREKKRIDRLIRDLDRLRRRGRVTVVAAADSLVTVFRQQ